MGEETEMQRNQVFCPGSGKKQDSNLRLGNQPFQSLHAHYTPTPRGGKSSRDNLAGSQLHQACVGGLGWDSYHSQPGRMGSIQQQQPLLSPNSKDYCTSQGKHKAEWSRWHSGKDSQTKTRTMERPPLGGRI